MSGAQLDTLSPMLPVRRHATAKTDVSSASVLCTNLESGDVHSCRATLAHMADLAAYIHAHLQAALAHGCLFLSCQIHCTAALCLGAHVDQATCSWDPMLDVVGISGAFILS